MILRWAEMFSVFVGLPTMVYLTISNLTLWVMPLLGVTGLLCLSLLLVDKQFKRFRLVNTKGFANHAWAALRLFLPWACIISLMIYLLLPELFLSLPLEDPQFWVITLLIYPLISVIPQEIIFRTFFFHRYKSILPSKSTRVWVSAFFFGLAHLVYGNWIAVIMSWVGGGIFGYRYAQTRSTAVVVFEHTLWGSFIFSIGLGAYFLI